MRGRKGLIELQISSRPGSRKAWHVKAAESISFFVVIPLKTRRRTSGIFKHWWIMMRMQEGMVLLKEDNFDQEVKNVCRLNLNVLRVRVDIHTDSG